MYCSFKSNMSQKSLFVLVNMCFLSHFVGGGKNVRPFGLRAPRRDESENAEEFSSTWYKGITKKQVEQNKYPPGNESISHLGKRKTIDSKVIFDGRYVNSQEGTPPKFKSAPSKNGGWKTTLSQVAFNNFSGAIFVKIRGRYTTGKLTWADWKIHHE